MGREGILSDDRNSIVAALRVERALGGLGYHTARSPIIGCLKVVIFQDHILMFRVRLAFGNQKYFVTKINSYGEKGRWTSVGGPAVATMSGSPGGKEERGAVAR